MITGVSSEIAPTLLPVIAGPGKTPLASTVLRLWVNTTSRNEKTKNERAAETIGSKFEVRDLQLGIGADRGGDTLGNRYNIRKRGHEKSGVD